MLGRRGFAGTQVAAEWPSIVGQQLADRTLPERVVHAPGRRGDGTLHVRIASGALAVELQHLEPLIVERINTYFGYRAITRLKLKHAPIPQRTNDSAPARILAADDAMTVDRSVSSIEDPTLRQALRNLGRSLFAQPSSRDV